MGLSREDRIVLELLAVLVIAQIATAKFRPSLYRAAITFSQTLRTALGDWAADTGQLGYGGSALVFATGLAIIAVLYVWANVSHVLLS